MSRLYSVLPKDTADNENTENISEIDRSTDDVAFMVDEMSAYLETQTDKTTAAMEHIAVGEAIWDSMQNLPLGSKEYFAALKPHTTVIEILSKRMGVTHMPSLEDYKNEYAMRSSHQIAMEGVADFLKKAWETLKRFMVEFFKKVTVFMKRLLRANLDLESYEKYNDQLINKLRVNNATISDNSPVNTKLGKLLGDMNQEAVDSDYILRTGMSKVNVLVNLLQMISKSQGLNVSRESLKKLRELIADYSDEFSKGGYGSKRTPDVDMFTKVIREQVVNIFTSMFGNTVDDIKSLPDDVYAKLMDEISTADIAKSELSIKSLVNAERPTASLPKDLNIYFANLGSNRIFVASHKDEHDSIPAVVKPVGQLSNLINLHTIYKKEIQPIDIGKTTKMLDGISDEIHALLNLLSGKWVKKLEDEKQAASVPGVLPWKEVLEHYASLNSGIRLKFLADAKNFDFEDAGFPYAEDMSWMADAVRFHWSTGTLDDTAISNVLMDPETRTDKGKVIQAGVLKVLSKVSGFDYSKYDVNEYVGAVGTEENWKKLQDLNNYLIHAFNKLQTLLSIIVSDVFGLFTEVRYELVRYMYESSRRYSY